MNPKVSIVIPAWFKKGMKGKYGEEETFWFAAECLKKLVANTPRELYELIIIDNGSALTDDDVVGSWAEGDYAGQCELLKDVSLPSWYWKQADRLIVNKTNRGFAKACNLGFEAATGEYVCCLNNDIIVWPGWLEAVLKVFDHTELVPPPGVVMTALITETSDAREALELPMPCLNKNAGVFGAKAEFGSCWIAPAALLKKIAKRRDGRQVFDENFQIGMGEDRWLWQEVRMEGYETYRCHDTRVFHLGQLTMGKIKDRRATIDKNHEYLAKLKKEHGIS